MKPSIWHRLQNFIHCAVLLLGMVGMAWLCARILWGEEAGFWALGLMGLAILLSPRLSKDFIFSLYEARPLSYHDIPRVIENLEKLSRRAKLPCTPTIYYVPSSIPNAFAVGNASDAGIAVSDGILRILNLRELTGVLAHEISHIANRDLWIMGLADMMSRVTMVFSYAGQFLLIFNLPLLLVGAVHIPWGALLVLAFSPSIMSLLQLALSRAREYHADLGAAELTGDPRGLASALGKMERVTGRFWEEILLPGRRIPEPSLLRTHPPTERRIQRLMRLVPREKHPLEEAVPVDIPSRIPLVMGSPRWRRGGIWR